MACRPNAIQASIYYLSGATSTKWYQNVLPTYIFMHLILFVRCNLLSVIAEVDRLLRPGGNLIVRDKEDVVNEIEEMAKSLNWDIRMIYSTDKEGLLCVQKTMWRPESREGSD